MLAASASVVLQGFQSVYKPKRSGTVSFAELLDAVASVDPEMRIRFTSPHPKEFSDEVLQVRPGCFVSLLLHYVLVNHHPSRQEQSKVFGQSKNNFDGET